MRFLLGSVVLLGLACASGPSSQPEDLPATHDPLPDPVPAPALRIEPANAHVIAGTSPSAYPFRALDQSGNPVDVYWRLEDPQIGEISATGVFAPCFGGGQTQLRALLRSDTTKTAVTSLTVFQAAIAIVGINTINYSPSGAVVRLDSLAGSIDVGGFITAAALVCKQVMGSRLELLQAGTTTRLDSVAFSPSPTANLTYTFHWNAASAANGTYFLRTVLILSTYEYAGNSIPVEVRNPPAAAPSR